jgi:predicted dienelactone hydrolase
MYRYPFYLMFFMLFFAGSAFAADAVYDPLAVSVETVPRTFDTVVYDKTRQREIPIRVYLPESSAPAPVVLFSHGLGGSRENDAYLGQHWAARGYVAVFMQHHGSDEDVWAGKPVEQRMRALRDAASLQNFMLRVKDVPAVLDQLERWNHDGGQALYGRLDMSRIGMSGHSFGAVTTQAVSGQKAAFGNSFTDSRIKAAIMFSPSVPRFGSAKAAFGEVKIPWLLMTGTADVAPVGNIDVASRLAVFPALPPGGKYELVLYGAEHSAFGDRALPNDKAPRNPNHHRAILAISTAFWDAWLRDDAQAKAWLDGDGPRSVLESRDRWQRK